MINNQLVTFISVVESGSFSKAADTLFISPTAVMKQIDNLENRLNLQLFIRTNQGLVLTETGKSVYQDAKYLVDYSSRALEKAKNISIKENKPTIRIGTSVMTPAKFILDIWDDIHNIIPDLNVELIPFENTKENAREILKNLGQQIDIVAGLYDDNFKKTYNLQVIPLEERVVSLAIPISNQLSNKSLINYQDLINEEVMIIYEGWNYYIDIIRKELNNKNIKIIDFDFFNLSVFNLAVKKNTPIVVSKGFENVHPLMKIIPLNTNVKIPYGIMYGNNPSIDVTKFIKEVKEII